MGTTSLGGGEVTGGRGFGVVSGEAVRQQRQIQQDGMPQGIPATTRPVSKSNEQSIPTAATICPARTAHAAKCSN